MTKVLQSQGDMGKSGADLLPVMVYLHAGEFRFGASNDRENNWPYFANKSVILVTVRAPHPLKRHTALVFAPYYGALSTPCISTVSQPPTGQVPAHTHRNWHRTRGCCCSHHVVGLCVWLCFLLLRLQANVRLGVLGFGALDSLRTRDPSGATGNYGMQVCPVPRLQPVA